MAMAKVKATPRGSEARAWELLKAVVGDYADTYDDGDFRYEAWQYMGTERPDAGTERTDKRVIHVFRHRLHPRSRGRVYVRVYDED